MAGSEQRPTDDLEGHGYRWRQDTEASDEDQLADDTEVTASGPDAQTGQLAGPGPG